MWVYRSSMQFTSISCNYGAHQNGVFRHAQQAVILQRRGSGTLCDKQGQGWRRVFLKIGFIHTQSPEGGCGAAAMLQYTAAKS